MPRGIAVMGATGGCGATTLTAALADCASAPHVRVLGLDGHGGGPHALWALRPERTVDHLQSVRAEVDAGHVDHIVHRLADGREVLVGPADAVALALWDAASADRLAGALTPGFDWLADLGRGDHHIARAIVARSGGVVVVSPGCVAGADGTRRALHAVGSKPVVVALSRRPGDEGLSPRAFRRLVGAVDIVEIPWEGRRARRLPDAAMRVREALDARG